MSLTRIRMWVVVLICLALLPLQLITQRAADADIGDAAIRALDGCMDNVFPANDDQTHDADPVAGGTQPWDLGFEINYFGNTYDSLFVNNNGNVTFTEALGQFTPDPLDTTTMDLIAPFWGDVDTRGAGSALVTHGQTTLNGRDAYCVNWAGVSAGVGYFSNGTDRLNSFQLILIDRSDVSPGTFDIEMNFDQIQWEAGSASGGSGGLGGSPARMGFASQIGDFFELPGSGVVGGLLDSNFGTGLIHNSRNSAQAGRYLFRPDNIATTGARLFGVVTASGQPVNGAPVEVAPMGDGGGVATLLVASGPRTVLTNSAGRYSLSGLLDGCYRITVYPPSGNNNFQRRIIENICVVAGDLRQVDVTLSSLLLPPTSQVISPSNQNGQGVPVIYWTQATELNALGCANGAGRWEARNGPIGPDGLPGNLVRAGGMTETPPGSGFYEAAVPPFFPNSGLVLFRIIIDNCPDPEDDSEQQFNVYIDPSGLVRTIDSEGAAPIPGATVTLYRSDTGDPGTFGMVPDGDAIMSPSNRTNPDLTDAVGHFGWDVIAGFYQVRAQKTGCTSPSGGPFVETPVLVIPPPVTDLDLRLRCAGPPPPPPPGGGALRPPTCESLLPADFKVTGTDDPDILAGTTGRDRINGKDGDDELYGSSTFGVTDDKSDCMLGGGGSDILRSYQNGDYLDGGPGNDHSLDADGGHDTVVGGLGNDRIYAGAGDDLVIAGQGTDLIDGGGGKDELRGEAGDDTIKANDGVKDVIKCGAGVDKVMADPIDTRQNCEILL